MLSWPQAHRRAEVAQAVLAGPVLEANGGADEAEVLCGSAWVRGASLVVATEWVAPEVDSVGRYRCPGWL